MLIYIKKIYNSTLLHYAAKYKRFEMLKIIISKAPQMIYVCDIFNRTPFFIAVRKMAFQIIYFFMEMKNLDINSQDIIKIIFFYL